MIIFTCHGERHNFRARLRANNLISVTHKDYDDSKALHLSCIFEIEMFHGIAYLLLLNGTQTKRYTLSEIFSRIMRGMKDFEHNKIITVVVKNDRIRNDWCITRIIVSYSMHF